MKPLRSNSFLSDRGTRLAGVVVMNAGPPPPPGGQVGTAPVVSPPATGAGKFLTQGSAAVEARAAHNREVAGSTPAPATNSVAKASEDNGRIDAAIGSPMAGEVSRGGDAFDRQRRALADFSGEDDGRDVEAFGGAASVITLSDHAMILLRAIATYEQVDHAAAISMALATHATRIGCGPLARACLDEIERCRALTDNPPRATESGVGGVNACPAGDLAGDDLHAVPDFRRCGENRFRSGVP